MAMTEKTRVVFEYLKEHIDENLTAAQVAEALKLEKRQVDGIFTSSFQRKNFGERVPDEITLEDGTHQKVKYLRLNEAGLALDPDA